jgi:hypothetical protein
MYKVYYKFDCYNECSCYYLVNKSEIDNLNEVKFKFIFKDDFYRIRMYEQICEQKASNHIEIISDLQLLDYNKFLEFYDLMIRIFKLYSKRYTRYTDSLLLVLDLILINWDVSYCLSKQFKFVILRS